ncbi:MAG: CHAT domain-containing tetratricopeptide repeat protein [Balneolaceae bacterium]
MTLLLWVLLFLQSGESPLEVRQPLPEPEEAATTWIEAHYRLPDRAEPVWALVQYDRESPSWSQRVRRTLKPSADSLWTAWIESESGSRSESEILLQMAIQAESEPLLLYLQLQESDQERREWVETFYAEVGSSRLASLNRSIAEGASPRPEHLEGIRDPFVSFLLLYYAHRLPEQGDQLFEWILEHLQQPDMDRSVVRDPIRRDILAAARFRAAYELDRYGVISSLYPQLSDLPWIPGTSLRRNLYRALDFALYMNGQIDRSLEVQRTHTLPLTSQLAPESEPDVLSTYGGYLYTLGRFQDAESVFLQILDRDEPLSPALQARLLNNLGLVYYKLGDHDRYIETQMQAREIALRQDNDAYLVQIYRNLHIYYRKNRQMDAARRAMQEARQIAARMEDPQELITLTISAANFSLDYLDQPDEAQVLLDRAQALLDQSPQEPLYLRMLTEQAALYRVTGMYDRAEPVLREVLASGVDTGNERMILNAHLELARLALLQHRPNAAIEEVDAMSSYNLRLLDFPDLVQYHRIRAEIAILDGKPARAEEILKQIYRPVVERARHTSDPESGYWTIEPAYLDLFELYANLLIDQNRLAEAAVRLDQLKTMNDASLTDHPLLLSDRLSEEELAENRRLQQRMEQLRREWVNASGDEQFEIQNELTSLAARRNRIDRQSQGTPDTASDGIEILNELDRNEVLIHQTRIRDTLYQIRFTRNRAEFERLAFTTDMDRTFQEALSGLAGGRPDLMKLHKLYLWLGLDQVPPGTDRITLLPDSYLYQLPIDILPTTAPDHSESYGSSRYLIEEVSIVYLNRFHERANRRDDRSYEDLFSGFAVTEFHSAGTTEMNPLPEAVPEVESIASILNPHGKTRTFLNREATHAAFLESATRSRILHLATHSIVSDQDPLYSHMMLWPDESSDPLAMNETRPLYAWQLFRIPFQNQLIMLNSCDTAGGHYLQGAGVMGFSRALRYAGAESLILNAWPVHDRTARELATKLYRELADGTGRADGLQRAKISLIEEQANPHYWGAWILFGNPEPLLPGIPWKRWSLLLLLVATVGYWRWHIRFKRTAL